MDDRTIARRYFVSGIVQGVGFRLFAQRTAARLGIRGYARNLFDGRVEVCAVGTSSTLQTFREELKRGPLGASVSSVREEEASVQDSHAKGFSIEYDV
ncbi:MAG: acylphosphatase [Candidatus Acidiferrales bacterium]